MYFIKRLIQIITCYVPPPPEPLCIAQYRNPCYSARSLHKTLVEYQHASDMYAQHFNACFESMVSSGDPPDMEEQVTELMNMAMDAHSLQYLHLLPSVPRR